MEGQADDEAQIDRDELHAGLQNAGAVALDAGLVSPDRTPNTRRCRVGVVVVPPRQTLAATAAVGVVPDRARRTAGGGSGACIRRQRACCAVTAAVSQRAVLRQRETDFPPTPCKKVAVVPALRIISAAIQPDSYERATFY